MTIALLTNTVHLWQVYLPDWFDQKEQLIDLLDEAEKQRAYRYKFDIHRHRFLVTRAFLRKILNLYTAIPAEQLVFDYGSRGKPYLQASRHPLQFNVSHSGDWAVYAMTVDTEIGVDIEIMQKEYKDAVAKKFFSDEEYTTLSQLPYEKQAAAFYHLWVKKEATIKALGEGLYTPLNDFTVSCDQIDESVQVNGHSIYLHSFSVTPEYPVAVAMLKPAAEIIYWQWLQEGYRRMTLA